MHPEGVRRRGDNKGRVRQPVVKRMGTALSNLTKDSRKTGVTHGGRGHGKLTQATIMKMTLYYGKTIRSCPGDEEAVRSAVFISFHVVSMRVTITAQLAATAGASSSGR